MTFTIKITFKDLRRQDEEEIVVEHPSLSNLFKEKSDMAHEKSMSINSKP